jgi:molybdopterin-guanine dinucleotide biosynthesis protein A
MAPPTSSFAEKKPSLPPVTGLVLAGGAGTRMGGDKPFRKLRGQYLIEHALANARRECRSILIASNENPANYAAYRCTVINDVPAPGMGPMAGILAGLNHLENDSDWLAVFAVDCPFLPANLVSRLYQATATLSIEHESLGSAGTANVFRNNAMNGNDNSAGENSGVLAAYARYAGREHFLASLWHRTMAPVIASLLDHDQRRVRMALQHANACKVDFAPPDEAHADLLFANINTQEDITHFETRQS